MPFSQQATIFQNLQLAINHQADKHGVIDANSTAIWCFRHFPTILGDCKYETYGTWAITVVP